MWCPKCGMDTRVVETEKLNKTVCRVRWCRNGACRHLFQTHEVIASGRPRGETAKPGVVTVVVAEGNAA